MTTKTEKVTVAHLTYNYWKVEGLSVDAPKELQEGYSKIEIPGESLEVNQKMDYAIKNKALKCGLFNLRTITPKDYELAISLIAGAKQRKKDESNTQI